MCIRDSVTLVVNVQSRVSAAKAQHDTEKGEASTPPTSDSQSHTARIPPELSRLPLPGRGLPAGLRAIGQSQAAWSLCHLRRAWWEGGSKRLLRWDRAALAPV
eukprot:1350258-Prymnesium_polylepis.1